MNRLRDMARPDRVFDFMVPDRSPVDVRHGPILYMEDVTVSFDGFRAIDRLNLTIDDGELRCIIGPNGAGKTTMMDIITGKTRPDSGQVWFGSRHNLLRLSEPEVASLGIGRKFQKPTVFEALTVFENLELAMAGDRRVWATFMARLDHEGRARLDEVLETIGLEAERDRRSGVLSHGQKQWLEIGMLLMQRPRLLLIDEPVAGMTEQEMHRTANLLNRLAGQQSVVVVEHDMGFVRSIARHVTVLHQGSVLAEGSMDAVAADSRVREVYLGAEEERHA
nr:urea ABC transporter ATP-binding protein UrtD [Kushneria indalinina]